MVNNQVFFCLGVDKKSEEFTDFGGGVKPSDITALRGGIREWAEESKQVFGTENYREEACLDSVCLIKPIQFKNRNDTHHMMIVFQEVAQSHLADSMTAFAEKEVSVRDEVSAIFWCHENTFKQMVYTSESSQVYIKVKKFIANCIPFCRLLYYLKLRQHLIRTDSRVGEQLAVRTTRQQPTSWIDPPVPNTSYSFRRKRFETHRPRFNFTRYTITKQT